MSLSFTYLAPLAFVAILGGTCLLLPAPTPEPIDVKVERAVAYMKLKDDVRAGRLFAHVLAEDPENARANHAIGIAATAAKRYDEAIDRLKRAQAKDPANEEITFALAVAYQKAKRLPEAEAIYLRMRAEHPKDERVVNNLAEVAIARGQYVQARALLQEYLKMLPASKPARRRHTEKRIKKLTHHIGDEPSPSPSARAAGK